MKLWDGDGELSEGVERERSVLVELVVWRRKGRVGFEVVIKEG